MFNVYHQSVMRQAEEQRRRMIEATGVVLKCMPAGIFAGERRTVLK